MITPVHGTYPAYFYNYIKLVDASSINEAIEKYSKTMVDFFEKINEDQSVYRYADDKWSIKEVLQHIIDTERIFAYRIICITRGDQTPLPGFDENEYAKASLADNRNWISLTEEFKAVRKSTDLMLLSFNEEQLSKSGITNGSPNTSIAIAFTVFGHVLHHMAIIKERYMVQ